MKILHTSDWHIGQVFKNFSRQVEHEMFLSWLKDTIIEQDIEVLLVAGDIFDLANPSSSALKTYYNFLTSLQTTNCKKIIITGGNHDGISTLDAPKELLEVLNISVISGEKESMEDKENLIIKIKDKDNNLSAIVCAVAFLRDSVVRKSLSNQSSSDVESQLKDGIKHYYKDILELASSISDKVPIIAMGHLTVMGSSTSDSEQDIYIGKLQSLNSSVFDGFDYVALGHLHRFQRVASNDFIRYSGSPICLSFSEIADDKKVIILDTSNNTLELSEIIIPRFRELFHIKGSLEDVLHKLSNIEDETLTPLVEITIENEYVTSEIHSLIYEKVKDLDIEVLQINSQNRDRESRTDMELESLDDITPLKAFETKCDENSELLDDELRAELIDCFKEISEMTNEDS
ncbi:MAG: exonuclease SbcCD subunit D C-terminal domain-containing protein [Campylobacterota bacterium]|nr:exonuclease SbcCD subunit D C-terminal domain-containing protein [Campylobacterota bacterium]